MLCSFAVDYDSFSFVWNEFWKHIFSMFHYFLTTTKSQRIYFVHEHSAKFLSSKLHFPWEVYIFTLVSAPTIPIGLLSNRSNSLGQVTHRCVRSLSLSISVNPNHILNNPLWWPTQKHASLTFPIISTAISCAQFIYKIHNSHVFIEINTHRRLLMV